MTHPAAPCVPIFLFLSHFSTASSVAVHIHDFQLFPVIPTWKVYLDPTL